MSKKIAAADKSKGRDVLTVYRSTTETEEQATARELLRPSRQAARTLHRIKPDIHEINALAEELATQIRAVNQGDQQRTEAFLVTQAHTLDELFNTLTQRSILNMKDGYLDACERYLRLALKAQSQCRTTLETLAEIKNPRPIAFVKQANIANGPQQVNNGTPVHARAGESENQANELKEIAPNEPKAIGMDARTQNPPSGAYPGLEAVGAVNRTKDGGRESPSV